jgi:hypothetical protein
MSTSRVRGFASLAASALARSPIDNSRSSLRVGRSITPSAFMARAPTIASAFSVRMIPFATASALRAYHGHSAAARRKPDARWLRGVRRGQMIDVEAETAGERHAQLAVEGASRVAPCPRRGDIDDHVATALDGGVTEYGLAGAAEIQRLELSMNVVARLRTVHVDAQLAAAFRAVVDLELGNVGDHLAALERDRRGTSADGDARNDDAVG